MPGLFWGGEHPRETLLAFSQCLHRCSVQGCLSTFAVKLPCTAMHKLTGQFSRGGVTRCAAEKKRPSILRMCFAIVKQEQSFLASFLAAA